MAEETDYLRAQIQNSALRPGELSSLEEVNKAAQQDLEDTEYWDAVFDRFVEGYTLLEEYLEEVPPAKLEGELEEGEEPLTLDDCKVGEKALELLNDEEQLEPFVKGTLVLSKELGIKHRVLLLFYEIASDWKEQRRFEDAEAVFVFLTTINPGVSGFWLGRGVALEGLQRWNEALDCFSQAQRLEPEQELPYLGIIRICSELGDKVQLQKALELAQQHPSLKETVEEAAKRS